MKCSVRCDPRRMVATRSVSWLLTLSHMTWISLRLGWLATTSVRKATNCSLVWRGAVLCVFRTKVTGRFGIVTGDFGNVTDRYGNVTERTGRQDWRCA